MKNTFQRVYEIVEQIPSGRVATYGQVASMLGNPRMSRAVGYALHVSPGNRQIPCHRVVNRFGGLARAFEAAGINEQRLLLEAEGVGFTEEGTVDLEHFLWSGGRPAEQG